MVFDDSLVAAGDEDEVLDAGLARLIDHVLDQRPVDDRQHLLGHRLGGREEAGAETGNRENRFADGFHDGFVEEGKDVDDRIVSRKWAETARFLARSPVIMVFRWQALPFAPTAPHVKHPETSSGPLMAGEARAAPDHGTRDMTGSKRFVAV